MKIEFKELAVNLGIVILGTVAALFIYDAVKKATDKSEITVTTK